MRTSQIVVAVGVLVGVAAALRLFSVVEIHELRLVPLLLSIWLLVGMAASSAGLLVVAAVGRWRGRPMLPTDARAIAVAIVIAGAAMVTIAIVMPTFASTASGILIGLVGVGLIVVAVADWRRWPEEHGIVPVVLLATIVVLVTVARERDVLDAQMWWTDSSTHQESSWDTTCNGTNWDNPSVAGLADRYDLDVRMDGNVGALLDTASADLNNNGRLQLRVTGTAAVSWAACLVPLYKVVSIDTTLTFEANVHASDRGGSASCHVAGTIDLELEQTVRGISSCRDVREAVARKLQDLLAARAHKLIDG